MKITTDRPRGLTSQRRHERHEVSKRFSAFAGSLGEFEGEVKDVSVSGIAVTTPLNIGNDAFVQLHIDGLGDFNGHVARTFAGGFALKFDEKDRTGAKMEKAISRIADPYKKGKLV